MSTERFKRMVLGFVFLVVLSGCSQTMKAVPISDIYLNAGAMQREHYTVLSRVEGTSEETSLIFGLIKIVDSSKVKFLGISFFEEKYAHLVPPEGFWSIFQPVSPLDRAYYNALAKTPDADAVLRKSTDIETSGIPLLFRHKRVTFYGKAIKINSDDELK